MRIISAASAFPQYRYDQETIVGALHKYWAERIPHAEVLQRLHSRTGVNHRHLVLPLEAYERVANWGEANNIWIDAAQQLGKQAICRAMNGPGISARDIDALFLVTVTGVASPSIDAKLMNLLHLRPDVKRMPIFGLGCVAGAAGIARAADYVRAYPNQIAALVSVELCSLTWQNDDLSVANLISTGLFGDGAAAVLVAGAEVKFEGPEIIATRSTFYPDSERVMGWDVSEKGFKIVLSPLVPDVIREHLPRDVDGFLSDHQLCREDIGSWIIHTGGPKILEAVEESLALPPDALKRSWDCLARVGNLSSASVLVVLEDVLKNAPGKPGTYSVLAAMGPGFCSELVLLRW